MAKVLTTHTPFITKTPICQHQRTETKTETTFINNAWTISISVCCADCGAKFHFSGPVNLTNKQTSMHVTIAPGEWAPQLN